MMTRKWQALAFCAASMTATWSAGAKESPPPAAATPAALSLTLSDALSLARRSAPRVLSARAAGAEADGARAEASIFPRHNPTIEAAVGPRFNGADATPGVSVEYMQVFGLGGGVSARLAAVDAAVARAKADSDGATQAVERAVALAFVRALWAEEQLALARELVVLAKDTSTATEQRLIAGDSTRLEVNVAKMGIGRAAAALKEAEAERAGVLGELRVLLGIAHETPLILEGKLSDIGAADLASMLARSKGRPDLVALGAELREAQAETSFADTLAFPDLGLGVRYEHEEKDVNTVQGVVSLSLPFFDHGQGVAARAEAKQRRVQVDLAQRAAEAPIEVRSAYEVFQRRREAVEAFDGASSFNENVELALKAYKAGESNLSELLLLRREVIDAKVAHTNRLLAAREAEIELRAAAGVLP